VFEDGERLRYTALVAATGSTPRPARLVGWRDVGTHFGRTVVKVRAGTEPVTD
jgi:NADPH-dependent 2,4-dienoyl-CoA reductase/sulfur reductase-like enzyme